MPIIEGSCGTKHGQRGKESTNTITLVDLVMANWISNNIFFIIYLFCLKKICMMILWGFDGGYKSEIEVGSFALGQKKQPVG